MSETFDPQLVYCLEFWTDNEKKVCHISGNSQRNTSKSRRRSSLAQLGELLKDWGARDKDKSREKGKFSVKIVKFMFSKKATKIDKICTVYLTLCSKFQIKSEDFVNFCGLLRKHEF